MENIKHRSELRTRLAHVVVENVDYFIDMGLMIRLTGQNVDWIYRAQLDDLNSLFPQNSFFSSQRPCSFFKWHPWMISGRVEMWEWKRGEIEPKLWPKSRLDWVRWHSLILVWRGIILVWRQIIQKQSWLFSVNGKRLSSNQDVFASYFW